MEHPRSRRSREELEKALEKQANRLLSHSLNTLGRGEYPFYSQSYLRRKGATDERSLIADEAAHSEEPVPSAKLIWRLARKARLTSIETDVVRLLSAGETNAQIARVLGMSPGRVRTLAARSIAKMSAHLAQVSLDLHEQIAAVLYHEQNRRAPHREQHCKPGQELCRKTGICPRRWYLRGTGG